MCVSLSLSSSLHPLSLSLSLSPPLSQPRSHCRTVQVWLVCSVAGEELSDLLSFFLEETLPHLFTYQLEEAGSWHRVHNFSKDINHGTCAERREFGMLCLDVFFLFSPFSLRSLLLLLSHHCSGWSLPFSSYYRTPSAVPSFSTRLPLMSYL